MGRKVLKDKDPSAPKPPLNSFLEFSKEERPRLLIESGNLSATEVAKEIGSRWRSLTKDEKEKFEERFHQNKKKYQAEKLEYEKSNPKVPAADAKSKKKKDPLAPKLPLSSFMEFGKFERPKILKDLGSLSLAEVGIELGKRWRALGEKEKHVFDNKSKENRITYDRDKATYLQQRLSESSLPTCPSNNTEPPSQDSSSQPVSSTNDSQSTTSQSTSSQSTISQSTSNQSPTSQSNSSQSSSSQPTSSQSTSSQSTSIQLSDLGFAQQKNFPWHPAFKTGVLGKGSGKVKVTFFGTGQSGTVNKSKWIAFSGQAEARIKTPNLMKSAAFKSGLEQMKILLRKLEGGQGSSVITPGIDFIPQIGRRRFRSLNKDHLQMEEEENLRQMEKKMRQEGNLWICRDCPWKGKFSLKAKSHARDCGQRRKISSKKVKEKKYDCSNGDCGLSFALRSQLLKHYRYLCFYCPRSNLSFK